jgi:hypothetical protein
MTDEERQKRNALCDWLVKEGIGDKSIEDAITNAEILAILAVELRRKDCLACVLEWYAALGQRSLSDEQAIFVDFGLASAIAGERYNTRWQWEQPTLARELYLLRRAISNPRFGGLPPHNRCMILNNLGNRLRVAGRYVEALGCWDRTLELEANFGMALFNRAKTLAAYAGCLADAGKSAIFLFVAHQAVTAALAPTAVYTHIHDALSVEEARKLKVWIESVADIPGIASNDPLAWPDDSGSEEERGYRRWCLTRRLFLDPANDLGQYAVAAADSLWLPSHVVPVDSPHTFDGFFDQMKQEYVSARWMLYEGLNAKTPHFSDRGVPLYATEARPALSLAVEKLKAAYRISYSLFDKISFFLNSYMCLGIPEKQVKFRGIWRPGEKSPIRKEFDQTGNWGFCALYWLAKDFFEKENDEVAEPGARSLSDIRNHLEHKYLRVTVGVPQARSPDELAFVVSRKEFEAKALHLLALARAALIYLAIGIGFEERRRAPGRIEEQLHELSLPPFLADAEKV